MFEKNQLIPAIIQDFDTREILMLAYMNEASYKKTLSTKQTWFYSRSREQLWLKGESSGNFQNVKSIHYDCDEDTLLINVVPQGPSCHTNNTTCFYRAIPDFDKENVTTILTSLEKTIAKRRQEPLEGSYTNYLFDQGIDKILKKLGEESSETIIAAKNQDPSEVIYETCDLLYHLLVLLNEKDILLRDVFEELHKRHLQ